MPTDDLEKVTGINIESVLNDIMQALNSIDWTTWSYAIGYLVIGLTVASFTSSIVGRILSKYTSQHYTQIVRRIFYYGIIALFIVMALITLHLDAKVLGIATILTIGLGFSAQTAVSNAISGLFLVFERPFIVGDHIELDEVIRGELLSIDLFSIKIRTFDNSLIRIPNEMLLKTQFKNLTRFPIRRVEIPFKISLHEDIDRVKEILFNLAASNPVALVSPQPDILFEKFHDYSIELKFIVWVKKSSYFQFKNAFPLEIQSAFRKHSVLRPVMIMNPDPNNLIKL